MYGEAGRYIHSIRMRSAPEPGSYLNALPVVQYLRKGGILELKAPVTFLVGENGSGKSTLLEAIAVAAGFNAEGGTRNFNFATRQTHSELYRHLVLSKYGRPRDGFFLRAESFYNFASNLDDIDDGCLILNYGGRSLHHQSHGESFLAVVLNRFGGNGLYILDEPEAALSPARMLTLIAAICRLVEQNSQFIISTHSPMLMACPNARIFQLSEQGVEEVDYRETDHYQLTRRFLENPERMLRYLLEE